MSPHKGEIWRSCEVRGLLARGAEKGCPLGGENAYGGAMRRAFSLPELMLALALVGILLGIALPPLSRALDRIEVQAAANHLAAAHHRARLMAVTQGLVLVLAVDQNEISISTRGQANMLWSGPGPAGNGVMLAGGIRKFTFSPEGLTIGLSNATLRLVRGSATRTVVVSRLGRIRITH